MYNIREEISLAFVRLGEWDTSTDDDCEENVNERICADKHVDVSVEEQIVHPDYNVRRRHNDIALLRLAKRIVYSDFIKPICLPLYYKDRTENLENEVLTVAGT